MTLVSAVIIAHNGEPYIQHAVRSVLDQTVDDLEIIVVDDGSTDATARKVLELENSRIRLLQQDNGGPSAARNAGILAARGKWVAFLDCDDLWKPEKTAAQLQALSLEPDAVLVYSGSVGTAPGGALLGTLMPQVWGNCLPEMLLGNVITGSSSSAMVRRDVLLALGGFRTDLHHGEDWDLWLRIAAAHRIAAVSRPDVVLLSRPGSQATQVARMRESCLLVLDDAFRTYASHLIALKPNAELRVHLRAAIDFEILGNYHNCRQALCAVLIRNPREWNAWRRLMKSLLKTALGARVESKDVPPRNPMRAS